MPRYASIAIPKVPKDSLTYLTPRGLEETVQRGIRVVVPLGRRFTTGYVIDVHDRKPAFSIKSIREALDPVPVFSETMMKLCIWIARYYYCSLGDALKAALPQGMDVHSRRFVSLATDDALLIARVVGSSRTKQHIINLLKTGEVIAEEMLTHEVGLKTISSQLRELMMEGIVTIESILDRPYVRKKTINVVRLLTPWNRSEKVRELIELMEKSAPKQANLLAVLWRESRKGTVSIPMTDLLRSAKASLQQVRALKEKEIVEVLEEEITREVPIRYGEIPKLFTLTTDQVRVLTVIKAQLDSGTFKTFLLHGVTASGKTQVYIEAIRHTLARGRNAIVLVPEISLTPQLVYRFRYAFGKDVTVIHSRMSIGERYDAWRQSSAGKYRIVVGVRSAVFAPLEHVGLIVVDEEHESSYKQSDSIPRYHARDVAVMRGAYENATVLLGSATPSAESYYNAQAGKYKLLAMPSRIDNATLPDIHPVSMGEARRMNLVSGALSKELIDAVQHRITKGEGVILLQNRRGFAPQLECSDCGNVEQCENCSISLTYHKDKNLLRCHYCGAMRKTPVVCAHCGGTQLELIGAGTQRIEEDLKRTVPHARILRMDMDTTRRKGAHDLILTAFGEGEADVLLGTQMVAKGLDFDRVTLVGIISAEQSLLLPDFRAGEKTFQILTQVAGRSGRGSTRGEVLLQATNPDHPIFDLVLRHDYGGFITSELASREYLFYPPFSRLVLITFSSSQEAQVKQAAKTYAQQLQRRASFFKAHPPQPAIIKKINKRYRWHLLIRVDKKKDPDGSLMVETLHLTEEDYLHAVKHATVRIDVDVDPVGMM